MVNIVMKAVRKLQLTSRDLEIQRDKVISSILLIAFMGSSSKERVNISMKAVRKLQLTPKAWKYKNYQRNKSLFVMNFVLLVIEKWKNIIFFKIWPLILTMGSMAKSYFIEFVSYWAVSYWAPTVFLWEQDMPII